MHYLKLQSHSLVTIIVQLLPVGEMACDVMRATASRGGLGSRQIWRLKGDSWSFFAGLFGRGTGRPERLRSAGRSTDSNLLSVCYSLPGSCALYSLGCRGVDTGAEA